MSVDGKASANPGLPGALKNILLGSATYEYDDWNQMVKAQTGDSTTLSKYNADGLRVEKSVNGTVTKYVYEYDNVVLETDGNSKETARNVYGTNLISREISGQSLNYLYNGHAELELPL